MPESSGQIRRVTTTSAQTAGRKASASLPDLQATMIPMGVVGEGRRRRGATIQIGGSQNDGTVIAYEVWGVYKAAGVGGNIGADDYEIVKLCSGNATLSTSVGHGGAGALASASERLADTITLVVALWGLAVESAFAASIVVHSPADNTPAHLLISDAGSPIFLFVKTNVAAFVIAESLT